ncbi:MAG: hypothetical protein JRJ84_06585 [Deltaproteobacteria bacterium]|nr:hypothetical protein [Deltaproteobacteria bacterium]
MWKRLLLLVLVVLVGCPEPEPAARTAPEYVSRLEPLLYENGFLAQRILLRAAEVYNETSGTEEVGKAWGDEIVPLARHLADQAAVTVPPPEWADQHTELVSAWSDRADAYQEIQIAVQEGDRDSWKVARKKADDAKLREEDWFRTMNKQLAPIGLALDQFP